MAPVGRTQDGCGAFGGYPRGARRIPVGPPQGASGASAGYPRGVRRTPVERSEDMHIQQYVA